MSTALDGLRVLVTRPAAQAEHLCDLLEQAGAETVALPVLEIVEHDSTESIARLRHANAWDMLIFVSRNAVEFALPYLKSEDLPTVAAIGKKTAAALEQANIPVEIVPTSFDSEGLLAMSAMQNVAGKRILLVRGQAGREKLADTLLQRGAAVDYAEVYRRVKPIENKKRLQTLLLQKKLDTVTVASGDSLLNLIALSGEQKSALSNLPFIVMSERISRLAQQQSFAETGNIHVAPEASDEGLVTALRQWHEQEEANE